MRFRIELVPNAAGGWQVAATNMETRTPVLDTSGVPFARSVEIAGAAPAIPVPIPPAAERPASPGPTPADQAFFDLVTPASAASKVQLALARFAAKTLDGSDLQGFGRYLFATLIGESLWGLLDAAAGHDWIELRLALPADPRVTRLPWELMRRGGAFLAELPQVSLVREAPCDVPSVIDDTGRLPVLARTPRALFVVGTHLRKDAVRPGAEYFQLLRLLLARKLNLKVALVTDASPERIRIAVDEFDPDVVHFICHGAMDKDGEAVLMLVDDLDVTRQRLKSVGAPGLEKILRGKKTPGRPLPRMVVLSACYTAVSKVLKPSDLGADDLARIGQVATPLAAELVRLGVPVVVGMSGPIADQACRLFTRRFYETLAEQSDCARATAQGRLAAIDGGCSNPSAGVDWAFPIIFVANTLDRVMLEVRPSAADLENQARWSKLADKWPYSVPDLFCDRFEVFERFDLLLADRAAQQSLTRSGRAVDVLAIEVPAKDETTPLAFVTTTGSDGKIQPPAPRYGRSQLVAELAAKARADGHLPILVSISDLSTPLKTVDELLDRINVEAQTVLGRFDLDPLPRLQTLDWLMGLAPGPVADPPPYVPPDIAKDVKNLAAGKSVGLPVKAKALRHDLQAILAAVRSHCRPAADAPRTRLVLLIDDLHRLEGGAVIDVLKDLIGGVGLRSISEDIRIVVTWASVPVTGQEVAVSSLLKYVSGEPEESKVTIGPFGKQFGVGKEDPEKLALEERLAYEFYLMRARALVVRAQAHPLALQIFWGACSKESAGIPSRLKHGVAEALTLVEEANGLDELFQQVDDEDRLAAALGKAR